MMAIALEITPQANHAFSQLNQKPLATYIRIHASNACGCGQIRFRMQWDDQKHRTDTIIPTAGVPLVLDPATVAHLQGATLDYSDEPFGQGFRITAPAVLIGADCGCGCH
ncbi:MAG: iron-sulfur cluster assembly accessory protein [Sulfobacillus thermosulfidooxidans]|uniref:Iron-sulfur cluster assembly accessory protein n=1 Tax=Sulfobacillus thermosulfidooxidans TaxID=28034 RepID=A0A2T2WTL9_SULTH|nr:MAG: iron-sulfur cluster assembly accessory protein [Sulfobacillus thermosulfidooxidans]